MVRSTEELFAMDTIIRFTAYGPRSGEAVETVKQEVQRLDALLSTGSASSLFSRLNSEGSAIASAGTTRLLTASLALYESTGGLFDRTIYPLMQMRGVPKRSTTSHSRGAGGISAAG